MLLGAYQGLQAAVAVVVVVAVVAVDLFHLNDLNLFVDRQILSDRKRTSNVQLQQY